MLCPQTQAAKACCSAGSTQTPSNQGAIAAIDCLDACLSQEEFTATFLAPHSNATSADNAENAAVDSGNHVIPSCWLGASLQHPPR